MIERGQTISRQKKSSVTFEKLFFELSDISTHKNSNGGIYRSICTSTDIGMYIVYNFLAKYLLLDKLHSHNK
ncbi:MAG: hypothetical protein RL660_2448 [Bacteroidota bacterium]